MIGAQLRAELTHQPHRLRLLLHPNTDASSASLVTSLLA